MKSISRTGIGILAASLFTLVSSGRAEATSGAELFAAECAGCHGAAGDGKGDSDPTLSPLPRDLTRGKLKLGYGGGVAPTVELVAEILERGIPGTAMPSFAFLSAQERRALAVYVLELGKHDPAATVPTPVVPPAPPATADLVAHGKELYVQLGCPVCHGQSGHGDGVAAGGMVDETGHPDPPRNLVSDPMRAGERPEDLFLRLKIGMPGTPMPGYGVAASDEDLWALVRYLESIRAPRTPPTDGAAIFEARHCRACHQLDGRGGKVGPAIDGVTGRLDPAWLRSFLANPRQKGRLDPESKRRMPQLRLSESEIGALVGYLQSTAAKIEK